MRILIAEDEADIRDLLREVLQGAGHEVAFATTYGGAARLLKVACWDLMLTDLVMPGGNGLALADAARARGIPALLCTGHPIEAEALDEQGIEYLQKPFSLMGLLSRVEALAPIAA